MFAKLINWLNGLLIYLKLFPSHSSDKAVPCLEQAVDSHRVIQQIQKINQLFICWGILVGSTCKQLKRELKLAIDRNETLQQKTQNLQQQLTSLENERNSFKEFSVKFRLENEALRQKIDLLESHKKALIQELSGSFDSQDIEFITWEFLIEKSKEIARQLTQVTQTNQLLVQRNQDLENKIASLSNEVSRLNSEDYRFIQNNNQLKSRNTSLEAENKNLLKQVKDLERTKNILEQEKNDLLEKIQELNQSEQKLKQAELKTKQLESQIDKLEHSNKSLEKEIKQEKARTESWEKKSKELERSLKQLRIEIEQQRSKSIERANHDWRQFNNSNSHNRERLQHENQHHRAEINRLQLTIIQLKQIIIELKENQQLKISPALDTSSSTQLILKYSAIPDKLDLPELYDELLYFVQNYFDCSGLEISEICTNSENFYLEFIDRLCLIDTILIDIILFLEQNFAAKYWEVIYEKPAVDYDYYDKFLFWSNGKLLWELKNLFTCELIQQLTV